ncbi:hypothetical protein ZWY2020_033258 [Hordeum vulgare]|nr:hypothetical protein ZWY2020_033258 [Hordeum vulgare]
MRHPCPISHNLSLLPIPSEKTPRPSSPNCHARTGYCSPSIQSSPSPARAAPPLSQEKSIQDRARDQHHHKKTEPATSYDFSTRALRDFSSGVFNWNAAKPVHIVSGNAVAKKPMDFQALLMKATMDSLFTIAFGMDLATLSGSDEGRCIAASFDAASEFILLCYVDAFWKVSRFPNVGTEAALGHRIKVVDEFVYKHIRAKAEEMSAGAKAHDAGSKDDLLSRFILATNSDTGKVDYKYPRDIILDIVMAGKVTTAEALAWFLYVMCKHPEVQEKISKEAADVGEATSSIDDFSCSLTHEALNKMHYLHAALTETLPLYPSLPLDNKECFSDDVLPNGFSVGKGDIVFYAPYAMGRMERLWGEDALSSCPKDGSTSVASSCRRALLSSLPVSVGLSVSSPVTMSSVWSPRRIITTLAHRSLTRVFG